MIFKYLQLYDEIFFLFPCLAAKRSVHVWWRSKNYEWLALCGVTSYNDRHVFFKSYFFYCDAVGLSPMWLILIASEDVWYSSRMLKSSFFFISCNTSIIRPSGPDACYFSCGFWADFEFEL